MTAIGYQHQAHHGSTNQRLPVNHSHGVRALKTGVKRKRRVTAYDARGALAARHQRNGSGKQRRVAYHVAAAASSSISMWRNISGSWHGVRNIGKRSAIAIARK